MTCPVCGLPDAYRGQGDGIGSCDCPRCDCCHAGPDECECRQDWDVIRSYYDDEGELGFDPLCNDPECGYRRVRVARKAVAS